MKNKRYVKILALKYNNEYIPVWELKYDDSRFEEYGEYYVTSDGQDHICDLEEVAWDMKKNTIKEVTEFILKPTETEYKIGETLLCSHSYDSMKIDKVVELDWKVEHISYMKGKKLLQFHHQTTAEVSISLMDIEKKEMYKVVEMCPIYILESGKRIDYNFELKKLVK